MNKITAQVISTVFNPVINPLITFSLLASAAQQLNLAAKIEFVAIAALFACGLIILCLFIFIRLGLINSPDIPDRHQRSFPLMVAAIVLFTGFVALSFAHAPKLMQGLMFCYATETLIVAIISYWWKISIHTASMACSLIALTYRFGASVLPFYLLLLFVGQARIVLKRHTLAQTIAGAVLGIVLTAIQLLSFFPRLS
jgi:membrane-associated phospholipid phosphatase